MGVLNQCCSLVCFFFYQFASPGSLGLFSKNSGKISLKYYWKETSGSCWYSHLLLSLVRNSEAHICFHFSKAVFYCMCNLFICSVRIFCILLLLSSHNLTSWYGSYYSEAAPFPKWTLQTLFLQFAYFSEQCICQDFWSDDATGLGIKPD